MGDFMKDSRSLHEGTNCPSPITRVLAFDYHDGPREGILQLGDGGEVYRFVLIEEIERTGPDADNVRVFGLSPLPPQTLDQITDLVSPYSKPRWPVWVPLWRFPTETIRQEIDSRVEALLEPVGPVVWRITTTDLVGTLQQVRACKGAGRDADLRGQEVLDTPDT
jgi:hypothetical protein